MPHILDGKKVAQNYRNEKNSFYTSILPNRLSKTPCIYVWDS